MKNKYIITLVFLFSFNAFAEVNECGLYKLKGVVKNEKEFVLKSQPGTLSEVTIFVSDFVSKTKLSAYVDRSVEAEFFVKTKTKTPYQVTIEKIEKINLRIANPLDKKDTEIKLIKKEKCQ